MNFILEECRGYQALIYRIKLLFRGILSNDQKQGRARQCITGKCRPGERGRGHGGGERRAVNGLSHGFTVQLRSVNRKLGATN